MVTGASTLRSERTWSGMSQERLAEESGVSVRTVRGLESGRVTKPRRSSIENLAAALRLRGERRYRFLDAWGFTVALTVRSADEILTVDAEHRRVLDAYRHHLDRCPTHSVRCDVGILDRATQWEELEKVIVPTEDDVMTGAHVVDHPVGASVSVTATSGCEITGENRVNDQTVVFTVEFTSRLAKHRAHLYGVRTEYRRPVSEQRPSRHAMLGAHRPPAVLLVRAHFDPSDVPRRVLQAYTDRMDIAVGDVALVRPSSSGHAQLVLVEPSVGWHGLRWEWDESDESVDTSPHTGLWGIARTPRSDLGVGL